MNIAKEEKKKKTIFLNNLTFNSMKNANCSHLSINFRIFAERKAKEKTNLC